MSLQHWITAIRPQTLTAGIAPVIVGTSIAAFHGYISPAPAILCLLGSLTIQIGTNLANDYFDAQKGVDTKNRDGFTRVTASGLLPPKAVYRAMLGSFGITACIGVYLTYIGGLPILLIGILSIIAGITYAGGPFPFGSYALGDVMVFLFFGIVAVTGTFYVITCSALGVIFPIYPPSKTLQTSVLLASLSIASISTAILVVNNLRDIETDRTAGKFTLAVLIGQFWSRVEYSLLLSFSIVIPFILLLNFDYPYSILSPILLVPWDILLIDRIWRIPGGTKLNTLLKQTGQFLFVYSILLSIGYLL